ncbi:MAG: hypothetical protein A2X18_00205 [Bacteroidetes bacterium GWF2_40_14]|nr:MAG: hypothetical protein A2X18_00205 [Bacteroidetes bacterium GWF2_40_14]
MKKLTLLLIVAISTVMIASCSKTISSKVDEKTSQKDLSNKEFLLGNVKIENGVLRFISKEHLESVTSLLIKMTTEERNHWYDSIGFISQNTEYINVIAESNLIYNEESFLVFKNKYIDKYLFNNYTEGDVNPYLKNKNFMYSFVCTPKGNVMIGSKLVNYNTLNSFEETNEYALMRNIWVKSEGPILGGTYLETSNRKLWVEVYRFDRQIWFKFVSHKKILWSWHSYTTSYGLKMIEACPIENWLTTSSLYNSLIANQNESGMVWTGNISSSTFISLGDLIVQTSYVCTSTKSQVSVWGTFNARNTDISQIGEFDYNIGGCID